MLSFSVVVKSDPPPDLQVILLRFPLLIENPTPLKINMEQTQLPGALEDYVPF